jgi:uncharacterized protein YdiU (UPF0061 family)
MAYTGWQFGVLNKGLGDGRAFTFGQWYRPPTGGAAPIKRRRRRQLMDMGTKGSGKTPWSRGHDGRLTLEGAVREALAGQAMAALGVSHPTPTPATARWRLPTAAAGCRLLCPHLLGLAPIQSLGISRDL